MKTHKMTLISFLFLSQVYFQAFAETPAATSPVPAPQNTAEAELLSKSGSKVKGRVHFTELSNSLKVDYEMTGLLKNSTHGFHIHEKGDCSSADAKSAGKHYIQVAPTGGTAKDSPAKHAGDLPQIKADANGTAKGTFEVPILTISKDMNHTIVGRAIIVHGGPDNPQKNAAPRVACGVIETKKNGGGKITGPSDRGAPANPLGPGGSKRATLYIEDVESLLDNKAQYDGLRVSVSGQITKQLDSKSFILESGGVLNDEVLVMTTKDQDFSQNLKQKTSMNVTGTFRLNEQARSMIIADEVVAR